MKPTGIKVTPEELETVRTAQKCSGMFLNGGTPMGDPRWKVKLLTDKYHPSEGSGLNLETGEFLFTMKRLNGQPVVEVMFCVTFVISIEDAERIVAASTEEMQRIALDTYIRSHTPEESNVVNAYSTGFGTFYTAYGKALADKRAQELKMLASPATLEGAERSRDESQ